MEHVRANRLRNKEVIGLFCWFISPQMSALIDEEAERIRGNPRNLEMASCLDPPDLPWKPSSWILGPPGKRAAIGRGPQEDCGIMMRRPSAGLLDIKRLQGPEMRQFRLEWRKQTAADQWVNFCFPTLRPSLRIVDPLDRWRHWALRLRAAVIGRSEWKYGRRVAAPASVTRAMALEFVRKWRRNGIMLKIGCVSLRPTWAT
jgi:hypothetical protein